MNNLQHDKRHTNITRIIDTPIVDRSYQDWNMDSFELDESQNLCRELISYFKEDYEDYLKDILPEVFIDCLKSFLKDPQSLQFSLTK